MEPTTTNAATRRVPPSRAPRSVNADAATIDIGSARVRVKISSPEARGGFSLIEYHIPPRTLVAPVHRHTWEDEHSLVQEGRMAALLGDDLVYAEAGELVRKPRRLWHTVWNPDDAPCRVLEIISPGGFEQFFAELAQPCGGNRKIQPLPASSAPATESTPTSRVCRGSARSTAWTLRSCMGVSAPAGPGRIGPRSEPSGTCAAASRHA